MEKVKNLVSFSGGKDSTAMLLMLLEKGYHIDGIIFADTGMEFEAVYRHIENVEKYIGRKITRLSGDITFEEGIEKYGWAHYHMRWCTGELKTNVIKKYTARQKYTMYVGIAADEQRRLKPKKNYIYPLAEWGITEAQALEYCYRKGFDWDGLYEKLDRLGCYACPFKNLKELRIIYKDFPEYWRKMEALDGKAKKRAGYKFRAGYTVVELGRRFEAEERQMKLKVL